MANSRKISPFIKALTDKELYPEATRIPRHAETRDSHLFRNGETVYKIKKTSADYPNPEITYPFLVKEMERGEHYAEGVYLEIVPLCEVDHEYRFGEKGKVVNYAIKMKQLNERYFLDSLLERDKVSNIGIGRVARKLAEIHERLPAEEHQTKVGRPEHLWGLLEDMVYEVKRYFPETFTQPLTNSVRLPVEKYFEHHRKVFLRRIKRGRIVQGHGDLFPGNVYFKGQEVYFFGPSVRHDKFSLLDVAFDVGCLTMELIRHQKEDLAEIFIKRYSSQSKDRELVKVLPIYQMLAAMKNGIEQSEWMMQVDEEDAEERERLHMRALDYFNLAMRFARHIPMN